MDIGKMLDFIMPDGFTHEGISKALTKWFPDAPWLTPVKLAILTHQSGSKIQANEFTVDQAKEFLGQSDHKLEPELADTLATLFAEGVNHYAGNQSVSDVVLSSKLAAIAGYMIKRAQGMPRPSPVGLTCPECQTFLELGEM